jgi:hypothetical protein
MTFAWKLTPYEIEHRLPLWRALSDLFLDTELDEVTYRHIARVVVEAGTAPQEIDRILWDEVFPALADNLRIVAGEWAGFDDDWLVKRVTGVSNGSIASLGTGGLISVGDTRKIIADAWRQVCRYLPPEYERANAPLQP